RRQRLSLFNFNIKLVLAFFHFHMQRGFILILVFPRDWDPLGQLFLVGLLSFLHLFAHVGRHLFNHLGISLHATAGGRTPWFRAVDHHRGLTGRNTRDFVSTIIFNRCALGLLIADQECDSPNADFFVSLGYLTLNGACAFATHEDQGG